MQLLMARRQHAAAAVAHAAIVTSPQGAPGGSGSAGVASAGSSSVRAPGQQQGQQGQQQQLPPAQHQGLQWGPALSPGAASGAAGPSHHHQHHHHRQQGHKVPGAGAHLLPASIGLAAPGARVAGVAFGGVPSLAQLVDRQPSLGTAAPLAPAVASLPEWRPRQLSAPAVMDATWASAAALGPVGLSGAPSAPPAAAGWTPAAPSGGASAAAAAAGPPAPAAPPLPIPLLAAPLQLPPLAAALQLAPLAALPGSAGNGRASTPGDVTKWNSTELIDVLDSFPDWVDGL